jgi:creatinine amidohydrolase
MKKIISLLILIGLTLPILGQGKVPEMRTRKLTSMTNQEVEDYLARNNTIIIPCGPIEMHGLMPLEAEYIGPLGWAIKMAEKADALVFPHFVYLYPGGTTIGKGTFYISQIESSQLLMNICKQLIRVGFKRFYFVSGHGPANYTLEPVIRQLYDEYGIPGMETTYIVDDARALVTGTGRDKTFYGLYKIAGQLEDIPLGVVLPRPEVIKPSAEAVAAAAARAAAAAKAGRPAYGPGAPQGVTPDPTRMGLGNIYSEPSQHSWSPDQPLTAELREQYADEGIAQIDAIVAKMDFEPSLKMMNDQIKKYNEELVPKFKELLNFGKYKWE